MWRNIKVVSQLMMFAGANFQQGGAWHVQMMLGLLQACYPSRLAVCGSERDEARPVFTNMKSGEPANPMILVPSVSFVLLLHAAFRTLGNLVHCREVRESTQPASGVRSPS